MYVALRRCQCCFIQDKEYFEEAMKSGYVECTMTTCVVTGAAGSGKTCTMYLVLNEDPPDVRQSTGLVEPVRALSTVVGSSESGGSEWSRVDEDKLLGIVAGATSVTSTDSEEQPAVQNSPSPPTHSTTEESFGASSFVPRSFQLPVFDLLQDNHLKVFDRFQYSPVFDSFQYLHTGRNQILGVGMDWEQGFGASLLLANPQEMYTQGQPERSSEAIISEQASHTQVIDQLLTKLAGLLKKPVGKRRVTKLDFLYFLDSGGQPQFHELLPSFVPNLSTVLFILKLSEKLSQRPVIEYYQEGTSVCSYQSPYSHEQILKHCIRALQPENRSTEGGSSPHVAVVGTHRDEESECEGETTGEKSAAP